MGEGRFGEVEIKSRLYVFVCRASASENRFALFRIHFNAPRLAGIAVIADEMHRCTVPGR